MMTSMLPPDVEADRLASEADRLFQRGLHQAAADTVLDIAGYSALGWARATLQAGMLADVRRLSRPRVAAFDVALTSQRAEIEALSPSLRGG